MQQTHELDATNKSLGRLAAQAAVLLRGKHKPDFVPYKDEGDVVIIKNIKAIKITGRKLDQKMYYSHSGYPGGLKEKSMGKQFEMKPDDVLRRAVWGMLPKNKLRSEQIKRLQVLV
jgi:large subunit ribosomal protein L13